MARPRGGADHPRRPGSPRACAARDLAPPATDGSPRGSVPVPIRPRCPSGPMPVRPDARRPASPLATMPVRPDAGSASPLATFLRSVNNGGRPGAPGSVAVEPKSVAAVERRPRAGSGGREPARPWPLRRRGGPLASVPVQGAPGCSLIVEVRLSRAPALRLSRVPALRGLPGWRVAPATLAASPGACTRAPRDTGSARRRRRASPDGLDFG